MKSYNDYIDDAKDVFKMSFLIGAIAILVAIILGATLFGLILLCVELIIPYWQYWLFVSVGILIVPTVIGLVCLGMMKISSMTSKVFYYIYKHSKWQR